MTVCQGCGKRIRKHHQYCRKCGFLRVPEVQVRLRLSSRYSVYALIGAGKLRAVKDPRYVRLVRRGDVEALLHPEWGWGTKKRQPVRPK